MPRGISTERQKWNNTEPLHPDRAQRRPISGWNPRRTSARTSRRNREAVIEAALAILPDDPNASMATIAERSGLGRTTVYRHFPARNDLLLALFARVIDEARAVTSAVIEEGRPAAETLRALGPAIITIPDRFRFLHEVRSVGEEMIAESTVDPNGPSGSSSRPRSAATRSTPTCRSSGSSSRSTAWPSPPRPR